MFLIDIAPLKQHPAGMAIVLLRQLLQSYSFERPDLTPASLRYLGYSINQFQKFLGREPELTDLSKQTILQWMCSVGKTLAPRTINHHRGNLITLWNHAEEQGLIHPPPRIAKRKEPAREPVVFTLDEVRKLWEATDLLEGDWCGVPIRQAWKVALSVLWDTACRVGTLMKADLEEVNLTTGQWMVPAEHLKGRRRDRVFQLHSDTVAIIKQSLTTRKKLWPFPFRLEAAERHLGKLLALAELQGGPKRKFHCIRRTAESYAAATMGIEAAASAVGHSVAVAKKHYISSAICKPPSLIDGLPRIF